MEKNTDKLNLFIGNNGAGKSSILEALDTFFNDREFIIHSGARSLNASIAPFFLIKKDKLFDALSGDNYEFANNLSEVIWTIDFSQLFASAPALENFAKLRTELLKSYSSEDYFLFLFGKQPTSKETTLVTFQNLIFTNLTSSMNIDLSGFKSKLNGLCNRVKDYYKYIYIPVETSIPDFLKIEDQGMQALTDKNLKEEIKEILSRRIELDGKGTQRTTTRNVPIINYINEKIQEYVEEIEESIRVIDDTYHFNTEQRTKRVNVKDFSDVIIDVYFSRRKLQKEGKNIANLSAGERKKALVDIAYAFISQDNETEHEVIIGIDEPETSLHISMCYEQYERIEEIANKFGTQLFVTTHWYGGLPILNEGRLYHVQKTNERNIDVEIFQLDNYFEERGAHPNDVNLKSFYDLTSSIVSAVRSKRTNWLIVEGKTDKDYLEHYLPDDLDVKILPVGGCTIVKKIYEYLYLPISANEEARDLIGKIYCLIDTDSRGIKIEVPSETKNDKLCIRRMQIDPNNNSVKLVRINDNLNTETEFEEVLFPKRFYAALETVVSNNASIVPIFNGTETIEQIFACYEFEENSQFSFLKGTHSILKVTQVGVGRNFNVDTNSIHKFFDSKKDEICKEYLKLDKEESPLWIQDIIKFYN